MPVILPSLQKKEKKKKEKKDKKGMSLNIRRAKLQSKSEEK
jgi:hypothetical protein